MNKRDLEMMLQVSKTVQEHGVEAGVGVLWSAMVAECDREERVYQRRMATRAARAPIYREQQARRNAAEVAKVRSAACPRCFSTHAGEC